MNNRQYYLEIFMTSQKFHHEIFAEFKKSRKFFATKVWSYTVFGDEDGTRKFARV